METPETLASELEKRYAMFKFGRKYILHLLDRINFQKLDEEPNKTNYAKFLNQFELYFLFLVNEANRNHMDIHDPMLDKHLLRYHPSLGVPEADTLRTETLKKLISGQDDQALAREYRIETENKEFRNCLAARNLDNALQYLTKKLSQYIPAL